MGCVVGQGGGVIYRKAAVWIGGFSPVAPARKVFVLQGPQVAPIPGVLPSTDNPLSLFGLVRATPR